MSDFEEQVTTRQNTGVDDNGNQVQQRTKSINTTRSTNGNTVATNIVWFIVGVIEIALAFRFVLKLFGANPSSGFVDFVYSITGVLTGPFDSIFGVSSVTNGAHQSVFEPSILVAAAVYALLGWGVVKLIHITHKND